MNASDIVGWAADGQALCEDCATHSWIKANDADPIFASAEAEGHDLTCDECGEIIIEAVRHDYAVYMEGVGSWTYNVSATSVEAALAQARQGEDEDGDPLDYDEWEMHEGEPEVIYAAHDARKPLWEKSRPKPQPDLSWAVEPFLITHPALRPLFPDGIKMAVDTLAGDNPPGDEGLLFMFLAYVACVSSTPMEELSVYDMNVFQWEDGDWVAIT